MLAIASLLLILVVSLVITRMASLALTHTGLSRQAAAFQARSAFTGVGFTTSESEKVVNHPVRRRILLLLMLLGNAGVVTAVASLLIGFLESGQGGSPLWLRAGLLALGIAALVALATSERLDRLLSRAVLWALQRYTTLNVRDYAALLQLGGDFAIGEIYVRRQDWMTDRSLGELRLPEEGVVVLALTRKDGTFLGAPRRSTVVRPGDTLVVYGRTARIQGLDRRGGGMGGEVARMQAVADEQTEQRREQALDPERGTESADSDTKD